jgi:putative acetyltransferase
MRFYEREGYHEIPLYGVYIGSDVSVCYERVLTYANH